MSKIISFSSDNNFSDSLDYIMEKSGYNNRSRFLRDAALHFSDYKQRGDLSEMEDDLVVEGHMIVYYQHGIENKLVDIRHSNDLEISTYNHSCLKHSHTCVDIIQAIGTASNFRKVIAQLQDTSSVDKISFVSAPLRTEGCC
ncbi:MAG: hypothetical protein DWC02_03425 [Candidatus Poseidoniales archaeon]|nr:MAG: hypothetical protein DWC02_03425 [Candidatus Poseidoniales archaeon]